MRDRATGSSQRSMTSRAHLSAPGRRARRALFPVPFALSSSEGSSQRAGTQERFDAERERIKKWKWRTKTRGSGLSSLLFRSP